MAYLLDPAMGGGVDMAENDRDDTITQTVAYYINSLQRQPMTQEVKDDIKKSLMTKI